jgi:hypothetical protein
MLTSASKMKYQLRKKMNCKKEFLYLVKINYTNFKTTFHINYLTNALKILVNINVCNRGSNPFEFFQRKMLICANIKKINVEIFVSN